MTIAERLGWTPDYLEARRTIAQISQDAARFETARRQADARRVEQAKIVFCAAAIAKELAHRG